MTPHDPSATQEIVLTDSAIPVNDVLIELLYKGETLCLRARDLPYKLGRESGMCDLYVPAVVASRQHCIICRHEGRLGVRDTSKNGTFVQLGQAKETRVNDEFLPLLGKGIIKLGEKVSSGDKNLIYFRCV